jgi:hypothetical protein
VSHLFPGLCEDESIENPDDYRLVEEQPKGQRVENALQSAAADLLLGDIVLVTNRALSSNLYV